VFFAYLSIFGLHLISTIKPPRPNGQESTMNLLVGLFQQIKIQFGR